MSSNSSIDIIKKFYTHLSNNAFAEAFQLLHEDFVLRQAPGLPYGGEYRGKKGVEDFFQKLFHTFRRFGMEEAEYLAGNNKVVVLQKVVGTTRSGKKFHVDVVQVYTLENGKIRSAQPYYWDPSVLENN